MNEKEKLFCALYAGSLNLAEAAYRAGYKRNSEKTGLKLIERADIKEKILSHLSEQQKQRAVVKAGLKRLAFGSAADAVRLIYADKEQVDEDFIKSLDLFNVSKIKFQKTGAIEIEFADRLKALNLLSSLSEAETEDSALPFYKALEKGARQLRESEYGQ